MNYDKEYESAMWDLMQMLPGVNDTKKRKYISQIKTDSLTDYIQGRVVDEDLFSRGYVEWLVSWALEGAFADTSTLEGDAAVNRAEAMLEALSPDEEWSRDWDFKANSPYDDEDK